MSFPRSLAVARANVLLQLRDPAVHVLMVAIPLVLIPFLLPASKAQLHAEGYLYATGAEQAVPGFAVLFAFLSTQSVVMMFFREFAWGTWDRLRVSALGPGDVVTGKLAVAFAIQLSQLTCVVLLGSLLYGYRPNGSPLALALTLTSFSLTLACFGLLAVALFATMDQALAAGNLLGMLMAGLGGAMGPVAAFPHWARLLAHASPAYWALLSVRRVSLDHASVADIAPELAAVLAFGAGFAVLAALRFRMDDAKTGDT